MAIPGEDDVMRRSRKSRRLLSALATLGLLALAAPAHAATPQQITFDELSAMEIDEFQYIEPTASSGLPVTVTSATPTVCSYEANYVTGLKSGQCSLTATQAGDAQFDPAPSVTRTVMVEKVESKVSPSPLEMVYSPDETVPIPGTVMAKRAREDQPVPTGKARLTIQPFTGEGKWEYDVPLDAQGNFQLDFNNPPIPLPRQSYGVLLAYLGDDYYAPGYLEDVVPFDIATKTRTEVTVTPKTATWGDEFTFTAKVVEADSGTIPDDLKGSVNFTWSGHHQASAPLVNGRAQMTTSNLQPGSNVILGQYVSDHKPHEPSIYGTSWDKTSATTTGLDPYLGYADGTGAVGVAFQPLYPISRGFDEPMFTAADLPAGLEIDESTGAISGVPSKAGTSEVTVSAEDDYGQTAETTLSVKIVKADVTPTISYPVAKAQAGKPVSVTPQITGLSKPLVVSAEALPQGVRIDQASGILSGVPVKIGTFSIPVTVKGPQGSATTTASLLVGAGPVTPYLSYPDVQGVAASPLQPVTPFTAGLTGALRYTTTGLPAGLTAAASSGVLAGTPTKAGAATVQASATGTEGKASATFTANIAKSPLPKSLGYPRIKGQQFASITPAVPHFTGLTGKLAFSANGLPKGLKMKSSTGVITGKPKVYGKKSARVTVRAANGTVRATVTMRFAKHRGKPEIDLTVRGARKASSLLKAASTNRLIAGATSRGRVHATLLCSLGDGDGGLGVCGRRIGATTHRVSVTPVCSVPQVSVTLVVTSHPTKKQSSKYSPQSWTRTWKVSGTPAVTCMPTE
jgi:Putative Ig domain